VLISLPRSENERLAGSKGNAVLTKVEYEVGCGEMIRRRRGNGERRAEKSGRGSHVWLSDWGIAVDSAPLCAYFWGAA